MEAKQPKQVVRIGILTQPKNDRIDPKDLKEPDQYILDPLKSFIEDSGDGVVVALRYDLIDEPDILRRTLDSLDGILFPGGFSSIRHYKDMPHGALTYYNTAAFILKYVMETKIPLLAICQGFQLLAQLVVDHFEPVPVPTDEQSTQLELKTEEEIAQWRHQKRDGLLADLKIFGQERTTVWKVDNPRELSFLRQIPQKVIEEMTKVNMIRHAHNWAITTDYFNSCKSLVEFFDIIGVDDGLP